jgi:hypothetical protein
MLMTSSTFVDYLIHEGYHMLVESLATQVAKCLSDKLTMQIVIVICHT